MLSLFDSYKSANKITEAVLVGRNLFNRNPQSQEVFAAYFDYLCMLAETLPNPADRQDFAAQAGVSLAFYSENADLNEDLVALIASYQQRLSAIIEALAVVEQEARSIAISEVQTSNDKNLKSLYQLKDALYNASTHEQFDKTLVEIRTIDGKINKNALNDEQNNAYDALTKEHTDIISSKMRDLEYKRNIAYNKQAADSFAKAFKLFRSDESKYKNQTQLFSLASSTLFAYDASRLFNETLIYYNHVYSYIFGKLDDDGKLALTRFSIECERKLR
jgi:hypothetical protein